MWFNHSISRELALFEDTEADHNEKPNDETEFPFELVIWILMAIGVVSIALLVIKYRERVIRSFDQKTRKHNPKRINNSMKLD